MLEIPTIHDILPSVDMTISSINHNQVYVIAKLLDLSIQSRSLVNFFCLFFFANPALRIIQATLFREIVKWMKKERVGQAKL